jgi:hypothetical protein
MRQMDKETAELREVGAFASPFHRSSPPLLPTATPLFFPSYLFPSFFRIIGPAIFCSVFLYPRAPRVAKAIHAHGLFYPSLALFISDGVCAAWVGLTPAGQSIGVPRACVRALDALRGLDPRRTGALDVRRALSELRGS